MDELIIRSLQGCASPGEEELVRAWRNQSPAIEAHYQDLVLIWSNLPDSDIETTPPSAALIRGMAEASAVIPIHGGKRRPASTRFHKMIAAAAVVAVVAFGGNLLLRQEEVVQPVLQIEQLATGSSETLMTELSDGTIVYLAPNSTLQVSPTPGVREVRLEGKAFFGVAKYRADWPFVVRSDHGSVHVLGTRFEFSTESGDARVVVVDGLVDFTSNSSPSGSVVQIRGGQMSRAADGLEPVVVEAGDVDAMLDWMGSTLVFENTPLDQAAREIEARFGAVVELQSDDIARQTITGGFKDSTFDEVVSTICRVVDAQCSIDGTRAVISMRTAIDVRPPATASASQPRTLIQ